MSIANMHKTDTLFLCMNNKGLGLNYILPSSDYRSRFARACPHIRHFLEIDEIHARDPSFRVRLSKVAGLM